MAMTKLLESVIFVGYQGCEGCKSCKRLRGLQRLKDIRLCHFQDIKVARVAMFQTSLN